jgi:hypothetical protein
MRFMFCLSLALWVAACGPTDDAGEAAGPAPVGAPVAIELRLFQAIGHFERPTLALVAAIGDEIVVRRDEYDAEADEYRSSLWRLDEAAGEYRPYETERGEAVMCVSETSTDRVIAVPAERGVCLRFVGDPERDVVVEIPGEESFLVEANHTCAYLATSGRLYEVARDGSVRRHSIGAWMAGPPSALVATETHLVLGYDFGEWGGAAYAFKLTKDGISGKWKKILDENVRALGRDSKGRVWIACGDDHFGADDAGLFVFDGETVRTIVDSTDGSSVDGTTELPKPSSLSGLVVGASDEVLIVANRIGLLSYRDGVLGLLWDGSFEGSSRAGVIVVSLSGAVVAKGDSLYVDGGLFGIIRFDCLASGRYVPVAQFDYAVR